MRRGFNLLLPVYGGFVFSLLFYPHEAKERMKRNCNCLGTPSSFSKKRSFCGRVVSTPCPLWFWEEKWCKPYEGELWWLEGWQKCLGSGSMLVWAICICMGISNANSNLEIHPTSCWSPLTKIFLNEIKLISFFKYVIFCSVF